MVTFLERRKSRHQPVVRLGHDCPELADPCAFGRGGTGTASAQKDSVCGRRVCPARGRCEVSRLWDLRKPWGQWCAASAVAKGS